MKQRQHQGIIFGCVADDFTGGSDMASFLELGGLRTLLMNDVPDDNYIVPTEASAIVIALKTRTEETQHAVEKSLQAFCWLKKIGAKQLFFKYCSTFDSTKKGNIGPVIDRVLEHFNLPYTIVSPALPINGRTVKNGHLYVYGTPLHESAMKNHPLTPMWSSDLAELLGSQSKYTTYMINHEVLEKPGEAVDECVSDMLKESSSQPFLIIVDHFNDDHAKKVVETFGDEGFLTGSSGLAMYIARYHSAPSHGKDKGASGFRRPVNKDCIPKKNRGIILAGSCSEATRNQIRFFIDNGGVSMRVDPQKLYDHELCEDDFFQLIRTNPDNDLMFYSTDVNGHAGLNDQGDAATFSKLVESTMANIASFAVEEGVNRIVVAGGETAGAVALKLGFSTYFIGESVSPGVPLLIPENNKTVSLVYKSGNFGEQDFFMKSLTI